MCTPPFFLIADPCSHLCEVSPGESLIESRTVWLCVEVSLKRPTGEDVQH